MTRTLNSRQLYSLTADTLLDALDDLQERETLLTVLASSPTIGGDERDINRLRNLLGILVAKFNKAVQLMHEGDHVSSPERLDDFDDITTKPTVSLRVVSK